MGLFGSFFKPKPVRQHQVPEGVWVAAIGDVHGQLDPLERLLGALSAQAARSPAHTKILVFVGDYIDRGVKSRQVVDRLIAGFPGFQTRFLRGNHDETLLQFLDDPSVGEAWRNYGGLETLASYGVSRPVGGNWQSVRDDLVRRLPPDHLSFYQDLLMNTQIGDYFFVHAGIRPGIPLDHQSPQDMMWIRDDFLNARADFGPMIVHGHTPKAEPELRPNRIGIDTGAYSTGVLTAVVLEENRVAFVNSRTPAEHGRIA